MGIQGKQGHDSQTLELLRVLELLVGPDDSAHRSSSDADDTAIFAAVAAIPAPLWQVNIYVVITHNHIACTLEP